jgi:hypothetical protein
MLGLPGWRSGRREAALGLGFFLYRDQKEPTL